MKKMTLVAIIMMAAMNVMNAQSQSPTNWEEQVVDLLVYGAGEAAHKLPDTIWYEDFDGEWNGYLPIIINYPGVAEFYDPVDRKTIGFSSSIRINNVCHMGAFVAGTDKEERYGGIVVYKAYTRPAQMVPFTDTLRIEEGKKEILKPWHWVPYEETFVQPGEWSENGEFIDGCFGMKRIEIYGPTAGDTTIYEVSLMDTRLGASSEIFNTFVVIGTEKSHYGVDEAVASEINIYPNPSNDGIITIKGNGIIEIFNILGQKVMGDMEVVNETKIFLESGLYIVRMNGKSSSKVIVRN